MNKMDRIIAERVIRIETVKLVFEIFHVFFVFIPSISFMLSKKYKVFCETWPKIWITLFAH